MISYFHMVTQGEVTQVGIMIRKLNNLPNKYLFYFGIFFVIVFLLLAYWQFISHLERESINAQIDTRDSIVNTSIDNIKNLDEYSMVVISDNLIPVRSWLLRSRVNNGSSGYYFITVYLNQSKDYILVNNGWVPLSISFTDLINLNISTLTGRVYEYDEKPRIGQDDIPGSDFLFRIDKNFIESELGLNLPKYYVQLTDNCGAQITCISYDEGYVAPHLGYTFQWLFFALCLSVVVLKKNKII